MKKTYFLTLVILAILSSSCYSYKIFPKTYRKLENNKPRRHAYIINDSLKKELKILAASKLFAIVKDSFNADLKVKLNPLEKSFVCGKPITVSMLTIGQMPVMLPDRYFYQFDEIEKDAINERKMELKIAQRVWFWDLFKFNKKFEESAGKAVLGEYQVLVY